ncbi:MAG: glycosyltransferase [Phycisphaerae bacterium]
MVCDCHKPVHILHVMPGLLPGGMELTMAKVVRSLGSPQFCHSVICLRSKPAIAHLLSPDIPIICMRARPNEPGLPLRLLRLIRQINPDVIHARNWGAWADIALARVLNGGDKPLILSFHGLGRAGYLPLRRRWASNLLGRTSTVLMTVSETSRRLVTREFGWPRGRVIVLPNGVDVQKFHPPGEHAQRSPVVVGTVGNLRPVKNQIMLLDACSRLRNEGFDLELRIAGEGELRNELTRRAAERGFDQRLHLPGHVRTIPEFLRELDLFVLPSDSEQNPNALLEAMATGLPCVATRVGGVPELLDSGKAGNIVRPGDVERLTLSMRMLLTHPQMAKQLGHRARSRACEVYSLRQMVGNYSNMYRKTVATTSL